MATSNTRPRRKRASIGKHLEDDVDEFNKTQTMKEFETQQKLKEKKIINNIFQESIEQTHERNAAVMEQITNNELLCHNVADSVQKTLDKTKANELTVDLLSAADILKISTQLASDFKQSDPVLMQVTLVKITTELNSIVFPILSRLIQQMTTQNNIIYIISKILTHFSKNENITEVELPFWYNYILDDEEELTHFIAQNGFDLLKELKAAIQERILVNISESSAETFITSGIQSVFADLYQIIMIMTMILEETIDQMPLERMEQGKTATELEDFVKFQLRSKTFGVHSILWLITDLFSEEGVSAFDSKSYRFIADRFIHFLEPTIKKKVASHRQ